MLFKRNKFRYILCLISISITILLDHPKSKSNPWRQHPTATEYFSINVDVILLPPFDFLSDTKSGEGDLT